MDELVPRFSHRENFADFCEDFVAWVDELVPRISHRRNFAIYCEDLVAQDQDSIYEPRFSQTKIYAGFCEEFEAQGGATFFSQRFFLQYAVRNSRRKVEPGWCHNFITRKNEGFV